MPDGLCDIDGDIWQTPDGTFLPTHKRPLGYVFQEASLFPHLSVRKNLLFGAPGGTVRAAEAIDFDEVTDLLGVTPLLDRSPKIFPAASASASPSAGRCCRSRNCC